MKRMYMALIILATITLIYFTSIKQGPLLSPFNGCSDTDGGQSFYKKGTVTILEEMPSEPIDAKETGIITKSSEETKLKEEVTPEISSTTEKKETLPIETQKKSITGMTINENSVQDNCIDDKNLKEYYCNGDSSYAYTTQFCPNGCVNGECVKGEEPYCSKVGTKNEGWYMFRNGIEEKIKTENCDGNYAECRTPGFDGKIYS